MPLGSTAKTASVIGAGRWFLIGQAILMALLAAGCTRQHFHWYAGGVYKIPMNFGPINLQAGEIFKIRAGKIHEIEANGFLLHYNAASGWQ